MERVGAFKDAEKVKIQKHSVSLIGKNMKSVWGMKGGSENDRAGNHAARQGLSGQVGKGHRPADGSGGAGGGDHQQCPHFPLPILRGGCAAAGDRKRRRDRRSRKAGRACALCPALRGAQPLHLRRLAAQRKSDRAAAQ